MDCVSGHDLAPGWGCSAYVDITGGYCWSFYFHATRLRSLRWILEVFRPSMQAHSKHNFRYLGVDQRYPGGFHASAQGPFLPKIFDGFDDFDFFVYNVISDDKHSDEHHQRNSRLWQRFRMIRLNSLSQRQARRLVRGNPAVSLPRIWERTTGSRCRLLQMTGRGKYSPCRVPRSNCSRICWRKWPRAMP